MKKCIGCDKYLVEGKLSEGGNWPPSRVSKRDYRCSSCGGCGNPHKNGERDALTNIAPTTPKFEHPELDRILRERKANYGFADKMEATKRDGFVYVMVHPMFKGVCKIGRSRDPNQRLGSANTWCPYSEFELHCAVYSDDAIKLEADVHEALARRDRKEVGEWFNINQWHAENLIYMVKEGRDNGNSYRRYRSQRVPPCSGHDLAG